VNNCASVVIMYSHSPQTSVQDNGSIKMPSADMLMFSENAPFIGSMSVLLNNAKIRVFCSHLTETARHLLYLMMLDSIHNMTTVVY